MWKLVADGDYVVGMKWCQDEHEARGFALEVAGRDAQKNNFYIKAYRRLADGTWQEVPYADVARGWDS